MSQPRRQTFFLDQAEFLGGAERFSLDFFKALTPTEKRLLNLRVVGGQHPGYQENIPEAIGRKAFLFPSVSGSAPKQLLAVFRLLVQARKLRGMTGPDINPQWVTNTPRGHFLLWMAKTFWRLPGRWVAIFHDFTTRPPWLLRLIAKRADTLVANSIPTRQYLRKVLEESDYKKIRIVENGVHLDLVPDNIPPTTFDQWLHIGRIDPRKGQLYTAEAADLLLERNPGLQFNIVGMSVAQDPRTTDYETQIKKFIAERQIPNVRLVGEVSNPFEEIAKHDGLLALSTEPETFGRVATEGLASNKLVLAFDQTGPREILNGYHQWLIQKGHLKPNTPNPLIIEANNAMSLAETIAYFADNPSKAAVYTKYGRTFIERHYSLSETKKRLVDVLTV